jgi:hypothetical protein
MVRRERNFANTHTFSTTYTTAVLRNYSMLERHNLSQRFKHFLKGKTFDIKSV